MQNLKLHNHEKASLFGGTEIVRKDETAAPHLDVDILVKAVHLVKQFQEDTLHLSVRWQGRKEDNIRFVRQIITNSIIH